MKDSMITETGKVVGALGTTIGGGIAISDVNEWLSGISIFIGIAYLLRKWYLMEKGKKKGRSPYID